MGSRRKRQLSYLGRKECEEEMTPEQMEHAIEFLLQHHAKVSSDIERNSVQIERNSVQIAQLTAKVERNAEQIGQLTTNVQNQGNQIQTLSSQAELDRHEIREAIENLVVGNEVTRDLAQKVASLQLQMSQKVSDIDRRVTDLESR